MHNAQIEKLEKTLGARNGDAMPQISLVPAGIPKEILDPYIEAYRRDHPEEGIITVDSEALGFSEEHCLACGFWSYVEAKPAAGKEPRRFCHHCNLGKKKELEQKDTKLHTHGA